MSEFLTLTTPDEALELFLGQFSPEIRVEEIPAAAALDRVTAMAISAPFPLPAFRRSTVDGYAVRAADTFGAGETLPAYLTLIGEIAMGAEAVLELSPGQCAQIHTGGMLPAGADAVVMVEHTEQARPGEVEIGRAVAVGDNVLQVGEDVETNQEVIAAGVRIRPAEIGGLMALGLPRLSVVARPKIAIISSGDEVVPPGKLLLGGQVYDVNSYTMQALIQRVGGEPVLQGIVSDDYQVLKSVAEKALATCDAVLLTAGSSVSARDLTAQVIQSLGSPGVLVHGINIRPGKPTILGLCDGKPVIGLPGNPVSALVVAELFVKALIERLLGLSRKSLRGSVEARLAINLSSVSGREDWVAVRLDPEAESLRAEPVFGRSNLIFTLVRADGLVKIPASANGLEAGSRVRVVLI